MQPNILVIITDDQRFDTIGALGNPHIHTPNIDRLVNRGFAFQRHLCTTPICTPARAEILTGCDSFGNGVPWFGMPIKPELTLLPQTFQSAGYHTIHIGKWHNDGHPRDGRGYDQTRCVFPCDNLNDYLVDGHTMRFKDGGREIEGHATELFTDAAIEALRQAPAGQPWFCYLGYSAPHDPHHCPPPYNSWHNPETMPLFPNYMPEHPFDNGDMVIRDELIENWPRAQEAMRCYRANYYNCITHLDANLGRFFDQLENDEALENTLILLTGDQGLAVGSHGLLGKENMYNHSVSSPLVLAGPGIPAGGRSSALSHQVDVFPTLCELAGVPCPPSVEDGLSLLPVMRGEAERVREAVLSQFYSPEEPGQTLRHTQRAISTERWKLTWYPQIRRFQLFDLENDPHELLDLLTPWRIRRRQTIDAKKPHWKKNTWAAPYTGPVYTQAEVADVAHGLWQHMLALMDRQQDPLPAELRPPEPNTK